MADNPNRDWRNQATGTPQKAGGQRDWQKQVGTPAAGPRTPMARTTKLALAGLVLSVLLGSVVVVALWIKPLKPACLVLLGASYDDNLALPHNVYGWKGLVDLA